MNGLPEYRERLSAYDIPQPHQRVSLRDQFAMAALSGLISKGELAHNVAVALRKGRRADIDENISTAYAYADAMLEARK